jgi:hypothetical protein
MRPKIARSAISFLNFILVTSLVVVIFGFSYWFTLQIQANRIVLSNPSSTVVKKQSVQSPNIGSGVKESKLVIAPISTSSEISDEADFSDANCNNNKTKPSQEFNPDLKLSQDGLFGVSKNDLELKAVYGNTLIYGQNYLDQSLINYTLCVINTTAKTTATSLDINLDLENQKYLNNSGRIMIYDNLTDYTSYYKKAYDQKLGNATPWGLSENDSISTFIRLRDDKAIITNQEFQDIRYRLTYNIAHEYFHHIFSTIRPNYVPFVEEGLAVFIAGKVTNQVLGYKMSCTYRISQAKLATQKTVDLDNFTITSDSDNWYKSNNISELYADAYYFISDIDQAGQLPNFISEYLKYPSRFDSDIKIQSFRPEFKNRIEKMTESDKTDCNSLNS